MKLRSFNADDFPALVKEMLLFQEHIASLDPLGHTRRGSDFDAAAYLQARLDESEEEGGFFLLAEENSELVGLVSGRLVKPSTTDALDEFIQQTGEITELYVRADQRSKGLGAALMRAAEEHFKAKGCEAILVDCFAPNHAAHRFYERCGYTDRMVTLRKEI